MPLQTRPVAGRWYRDLDAERRFLVTWVDADETLIEARFENGEQEQFPVAAWQDLRLEPEPDDTEMNRLSDEAFRRATGWANKTPDDFPDG